MRSAKEAGDVFPYRRGTLCYIEVDKNGNVSQIQHKNRSDINKLSEVYQRVKAGETMLYAVWPGEWSSDLFVIDDLDRFAKSFELI